MRLTEREPREPMKRLMVFGVAACVLAISVCGCSGQAKTAAGFCQVYYQQEEQYLAKYGEPANSGLAELGQLIGALSDWVPIFEALDQAAPPDIEPDVHNILDSLQQEEQDAGQEASDPLGGLASGLMARMMSTASWENLGTYIEQNCGTDSGASSTSTGAGAAGPTAASPSADGLKQ